MVEQCLGAATSIGANIAEGNCAPSNKKKESYFRIALNSSYKFDHWLQIFNDPAAISIQKEKIPNIKKENIEIIKILSKISSTLKA